VVTRYGMSNIGPIALEGDNDQMYLGGEYNEAVADQLTEVCKLLIIVSRSQRK
jgi:ATP-dependent Zn protease